MEPHGIIIEDKFWLSDCEIKDGFILFNNPLMRGTSHVLFLRTMVDKSFNITYSEGTIVEYKEVHHLLSTIEANRLLIKQQAKKKHDESQNSNT